MKTKSPKTQATTDKAAKASKPKTARSESPKAPAAKAKPQETKAQRTPKSKKLSALDAAARVLTETGTAMNCHDLIDTMAKKGYWSSPNGRTPAATLYAAIAREITTKGKDARFQKTDRGLFAV